MCRTLRTLAALAMIALISAGCANAAAGSGSGSGDGATAAATAPAQTGSGSSGGSTTAPTAPPQTGSGSSGGGSNAVNRDQAVKFAECMRKNGVRAFPDPAASGNLTIDQIANGSSLDTNSAAFKQAISACRDLEPAGFTGSKRSPEQQANALKFAQCIRDHGVKDFPDPAPDEPLVDTNRIPSSAANGGMSALNAAMRQCRDFAAAAGVTGGQ